jgi:hypothetical protein
MFNKSVIDVLSQVNGITNSIILKYPTTIAVSESQDMMISFDVSNLDPDQFPDLGLKDSLSDFLNLFKLFPNERMVEIDGSTINVSSGRSFSCYITDNIALMDAYNKDQEQILKTETAPSVASFDLSAADIKNIKSASSVFKDLSEVIITSQDSDINISIGATNKFNAKSNTYSLIKAAITSKEFEIKIPVDNFKMIPSSDYTIEVKYNSSRNSYRILMINKSLDGFKILMSVKV